METALDYSKIDSVELDGIDYGDYPNFCDAYISYAEYDGVEMTQDELDRLNDDSDFVYQCVMKQLF